MIKHLGQCFYCRAYICYAQATTDHFIPRRHGGKNSTGNRVLACQPCNRAKADCNPVNFGIWHPGDLSPQGQRGLLLLRRQIIQRQLSMLRQRRKISKKCLHPDDRG
jgi:5-methylcytosine-specific restriction endonuclease McrA